ncbi:MAG TPA: metal ABC transporter substrate-binding protein [Cyanobacteria bacterium UBA8156]|jgi:manganese/iron transport system substrate-binding protein|nr:metal ABC transporter substrate-binding protein [Cyanobacteria bacterium UBA8156]
MRRRTFLAIGVGAAVATACAAGPNANQPGTPTNPSGKIVAANTILADWLRQLVGDRLPVVSLLAPGVDPHIYEPTPQDAAVLETAAMIFYNGFNLEPQIEKLVRSSGRPAMAIAETVTPIQESDTPDPHVWGSVPLVIAALPPVVARLQTQFPEGREVWAANGDRYQQALQALDRDLRQRLVAIPVANRKLLTTHDAFQYFGREYGIEIVPPPIGISTEEQPSPQTLRNIVQQLRQTRVPAVFVETTISPRLIETIAAEAGVKVAATPLYSDSLGAPGSGAETYADMMRHNVNALVKYLV